MCGDTASGWCVPSPEGLVSFDNDDGGLRLCLHAPLTQLTRPSQVVWDSLAITQQLSLVTATALVFYAVLNNALSTPTLLTVNGASPMCTASRVAHDRDAC
jgi:hypothetical protein